MTYFIYPQTHIPIHTYIKITQLLTNLQTTQQQVVPNNLLHIVRLVTTFFQQRCYTHHITIFLQPSNILVISDFLEQPCNNKQAVQTQLIHNFSIVTHLLQPCSNHDRTIFLQPSNKSHNTIKLVTTSFHTCKNFRIFTSVFIVSTIYSL